VSIVGETLRLRTIACPAVSSTGFGVPTGRLPRFSSRAAALGIVALGAALVSLGVLDFVTNGRSLFDSSVATLPAAATLGIWGWFRRREHDPSLQPRLFVWTAAGATCLVGIVVVSIAVQGGSFREAIPLIQFLGGVGATGGLVAGVNELRSVEAARQAERARVEAELADRERERLQFLNNLLRHNVLNSVHIAQAYASVVREKSDADAELDTIQAQHDDVVDLVEDVRVLVEATTAPTDLRPVALRPLLLEEMESLEYAHAPVDIHHDVPGDVQVAADGLLRYAFENLLTNAAEHSDRDTPRVEVTAEREGEWVVVSIADDGPGVPDAEKESVFEPTGPGNHGLGLYLVDSLVTQYGGELSVRDNDPRGAVFEVRIPAA